MLSCVFRCAQKIVTQLESVPLLGKSRNKYEKLSQDDDGEEVKKDRKWWPDRTKDEEKDRQQEERADREAHGAEGEAETRGEEEHDKGREAVNEKANKNVVSTYQFFSRGLIITR
jgi:hypothetical protein